MILDTKVESLPSSQIGFERGEAKGEVIGEAKGETKGKTETAINLYQMGMDRDFICQATGLSPEIVQKIIEKVD